MEIEAKFQIDNQEIFDKLCDLNGLAEYNFSMGQAKAVQDQYLDTPNRLLLQEGYACRLREENGTYTITLKGLNKPQGLIHQREEIEEPLVTKLPPEQWPDGPVRDRLLNLLNLNDLEHLFSLNQKRFVRQISRDDQVLAELSLDEVSVQVGDQTQAYFELEVEQKHLAAAQNLQDMATYFQEEWELKPERLSKFERALAFVDHVQAAKPPAPGLTLDDSMAEAVRKILWFHFQRMIEHETGTRQGEDIEALHEMRVSVRRMRTAVQIFADYLDLAEMAPFIKSLRRTGRALGKVRDLDVFMEKTEQYLSTEGIKRKKIKPLLKIWETKHEAVRQEMMAYLDSKSYKRFKKTFRAYLKTPLEIKPILNHKQEAIPYRLRDLAPELIYQRLAHVRAYDEWVTNPDTPLECIHRLRISCKALRYTLEYLEEVLDEEVRGVIRRIKRLQDHLGDLQDAAVASSLLRDFLTWSIWGTFPSQTKPALDAPLILPSVAQYLSHRQSEAQILLDSFPKIWAKTYNSKLIRKVAQVVGEL